MPEEAAPTRLRFAPSPTGRLHVGGARTALFNWAFARRTGGAFLLRIEDTDRERSRPEHETAILEGLRWLGIDWDEGPDVGGAYGPYRQSERAQRYRSAAERLLAGARAYLCFCSQERLAELRAEMERAGRTPAYDQRCRDLAADEAQRRVERGEPHVLRFAVPPGETRVRDLVSGEVRFANHDVDDWIMVRTDGSPTYNFVVVADDADMRITHVLRGEEHLTNTPKQVLLFGALELEAPRYAHLPLLLGRDKKKLSKRTGDAALDDYREQGYPPEALANFLALQGWAPDETTTLFPLGELVRRFDPKGVRKGGSVFDPEKLLWMCGEYVRAMSTDELARRCAPFVARAGLAAQEELDARRGWFEAAVESEKERIRLYSELPGRIAYLFADDERVPFDEEAEGNARRHEGASETLAEYLAWLRPEVAHDVDAARLRERTKSWLQERGQKLPALFQPLRCALTGQARGVDLFEAMALLGPERSLRRIEKAVQRLG